MVTAWIRYMPTDPLEKEYSCLENPMDGEAWR